jgi:hypothetical protein
MNGIKLNGSIGTLPYPVVRTTDAHRSHVGVNKLVVYPIRLLQRSFNRIKTITSRSKPAISLPMVVNQLFGCSTHINQRTIKPFIPVVHIEKWVTKPLIRSILKAFRIIKPSMRNILIAIIVTKPSMWIVHKALFVIKPSMRIVLKALFVIKPSMRIVHKALFVIKPSMRIVHKALFIIQPFGYLFTVLNDKTFKKQFVRADNVSIPLCLTGWNHRCISLEYNKRYRWPQRLKQGCVC